MKKNNKKRGNILLSLGIILMLFSGIFIIYQNIKLDEKKKDAIKLEQKFEEVIAAKVSSDKKVYAKKENGIDTYTKEKDDINEKGAIGVIRIDKIDAILPIFDNTSDEALLDGAGILNEKDNLSSNKNTVSVLASHRGGRNENQSFLNIDKLQYGDEIKITLEDKILYYEVISKEVVDGYDWSKFIREDDKSILYLMSCEPYPNNYERLLVKTYLVKYTDK